MPAPGLGPPGGASSDRPALPEVALVVLACALALFLRLRGIDFLLPHLPLSDSTGIGRQVDALHEKSWEAEFDPGHAPYPLLMAAVTVALLPEPPDFPSDRDTTLDEHVLAGSQPWLQIRLVSAWLSVLAVPAAWLIARRFASRGAAVLAAFLVAVSLIHVQFAAHEKPHGPQSAFFALAVVGALAVRRGAGPAAYLATGLAVGAAIAALHSGVLALGVLPVAHLLRTRERRGRSDVLMLAAAAVTVVVATALAYPAMFASALARLGGGSAQTGQVLAIKDEVTLDRFDGSGFPVVVGGTWSSDPLLAIAVVIGLVGAIATAVRAPRDRGRLADLAVVLSFALPYFLATGVLAIMQERYLTVLVPFYAVLGAYGLERASAALRLPRAASIAASVAVVALAAWPAWRLAEVRAAPDTFELAARFFEREARPGEAVLIPAALDLPLPRSAESLARNGPYAARSSWLRYELRVPPEHRFGRPGWNVLIAPGPAPEVARALADDPLAYFRREGARWVVLPLGPAVEKVRSALERGATLVSRLTPEEHDRGLATMYAYQGQRWPDPWGEPLWRFVVSLARIGYTLEIWRLDGA